MKMKMKKCRFTVFGLLIALISMGANCPGCLMKPECEKLDGNKAACEKAQNCLYEHMSGKCEVQEKAQGGCMDIAEEAPCRASSNCFYDEAARVCLDAPGKNDCKTIHNETACNADKNCQWQADAHICGIKK